MKLEVQDTNYAATIVRVANTEPLNGLDRLVGLPVFGFQAIISKDTPASALGVLFTAESQLSEDFCAKNNLFRHREKNADPEKAGYIEDTRRVRAIKLKGNISSALWLDISSLSCLGVDVSQLKEGDTFTHIDGAEVCRKYVIKASGMGGPGRAEKPSRVIEKLFPKHFDTENWFKNNHLINDDETVVVTQKLHGTSDRFANQLVKKNLTLAQKVAKWFGISVVEQEYQYLAGTRNTVRNPDADPAFYEHDIWVEWLEKIKTKIPKGWVIYGEIIGYAGEKIIQSNYSYRHAPGQSSFYVYRISVVNPDGLAVDLGWDAIKSWCKSNGLQCVPELFRLDHFSAKRSIPDFMDCDFSKGGYQSVAIGSDSPCDEGVCIRAERLTPLVLKAKSPMFLQMETKQLDAGVAAAE